MARYQVKVKIAIEGWSEVEAKSLDEAEAKAKATDFTFDMLRYKMHNGSEVLEIEPPEAD